ncbi:MAG: hypothetical protein AB7E79_01465 [Rhodospirillaceae bacterium]
MLFLRHESFALESKRVPGFRHRGKLLTMLIGDGLGRERTTFFGVLSVFGRFLHWTLSYA